jgi:hypothetical protein
VWPKPQELVCCGLTFDEKNKTPNCVLGAVGLSSDSLEIEMNWIDKKVQGKPYGIDLLANEDGG